MADRNISPKNPIHSNHPEPTLFKRWFTAIATVFVLSFFAITFASMLSFVLFGQKAPFGNVALIKVQGEITTAKSGGPFSGQVASSDELIKFLKDAQKDEAIKAVVLEINSPGGSAVASSEIAEEVRKTREKKPVVSFIREVGASGAYWIASATERIYANPMSSTGSIGVISSYVEVAGLMDTYNVTYQRLVFGKYKDAGSPFRRLTDEEKGIIQGKLDIVGKAFLETVAVNRKLPVEKVKGYATGMVFLGSEAKEMGLIDEFGGKDEATKYLENKLNITVKLTEYQKVPGLIEALTGAVSQIPAFSAAGNPGRFLPVPGPSPYTQNGYPAAGFIPETIVERDAVVYT